MVIFHSYVANYQSVNPATLGKTRATDPRYAGTLASTMLLCLVWQPSYKMLRLQYTLAPWQLGRAGTINHRKTIGKPEEHGKIRGNP